jgi:hypothetical protein
MKTRIVRAVVVGALLSAGVAEAQGFTTYRPRQSMYLFNYEVSSALGSFSSDFISSTSWRGFGFEGRSWVADMISVGLGFDWNRFEQTHSNLVLAVGNGGTFSGPVYRYADQFAVKGLVHAYFLQGPVQPYLGVGIGGVWTYAYAQTTDLARSDDGFDFILSPEAGLTLTAARGSSSVGLNVSVRYNYTTADFHQVKDAQSLGVNVGIFGAY